MEDVRVPEDWLASRASAKQPTRLALPGFASRTTPTREADAPRPAAETRYEPAARGTGFYRHVREAIQSNRERLPYYAKASGGDSKGLSQKLITYEHLVLPLAAWFDRAAADFNRRGIPVVQADFVSMSGILPPGTPHRHRHRASEAEVRELEGWLKDYRGAAQQAMSKRDFEQVAALSVTLLDRIDQLETRSDSHFAMTKHLVESVGFAAVNGVRYHAASHGEVDDLVARFLRVQALGLTGAVSMDQEAQRLHERGIGILVNDLPEIPLRAAWAQLRAEAPK